MKTETSRRGRGRKDGDGTASCADLFKALGDRNRLTVVRELMGGDKHVYELNDVVQIEPNLLSHHLKVLRQAGIVESVRDGKAVLYSLAEGVGRKRRNAPTLEFDWCRIVFDE